MELRMPDGTVWKQPATIAKAIASASDAKDVYIGNDALSRAKVAQWLSWSVTLPEEDSEASSESICAQLDSALSRDSFLAGAYGSSADIVAFSQVQHVLTALPNAKWKRLPHLARWTRQMCFELGVSDCPAPAMESTITRRATQELAQALVRPGPGAASAVASEAAPPAAAGAGGPIHTDEKKKGKGGAGKEVAEGGGKNKKKEKQKKKGGGGEAAAAEVDPPAATDIRVGVIKRCWKHPEAEKLLCEEIDVGEGTSREIASGLVGHYTPEEMEGKRVAVLCNLKPRNMVGFKSHGMVMAATSPDGSVVRLLQAPEGATPGERIVFEGHEGMPFTPQQMSKKKVLEAFIPELRVNDALQPVWKDLPFQTSAGPITVAGEEMRGGSVA